MITKIFCLNIDEITFCLFFVVFQRKKVFSALIMQRKIDYFIYREITNYINDDLQEIKLFKERISIIPYQFSFEYYHKMYIIQPTIYFF